MPLPVSSPTSASDPIDIERQYERIAVLLDELNVLLDRTQLEARIFHKELLSTVDKAKIRQHLQDILSQ